MQVADIKRANSLLSDSAMFARDSLLIPTRPLPMGCVPLSAPRAARNVLLQLQCVELKRLNSLRQLLLPWDHRQEYSAWAGMIVTQYGQISRSSQERAGRGYSGSGSGENPSQSAIAQLRAHYGLSPASSPTASAGA